VTHIRSSSRRGLAWKARLIVCAGLALSSESASSTGDLIGVHLDRTVMDAPAVVRITITVSPHHVNRSFRIEAESPAYYRSSQVPLNGEAAARKHTIVYRGLPEGRYAIRAELWGVADLLAVARQQAVVRGADEPFLPDCDQGACQQDNPDAPR